MEKTEARIWQNCKEQYEHIEGQLGAAADKLCMLEQVVNIQAELDEVGRILENVEGIARSIDNFRLSALAKAVQLLLRQLTRSNIQEIQPSTSAYLIYSVKTISRLAGVSKYACQTGFELPDSGFGEAIGAIIDHTDELSLPHMTR